ncbi:hypothetical protein BH23GEM6_BH23GEM6_22060 [soil metagenome]
MPNSGLHLSYALSALDIWSRNRSNAPFPVDDQRAADLFIYGSVAPDIGFFPGTRRDFSELAHRNGGAGLIRLLRRSAITPAQRGYMCGWVAHLLADRVVHPLIDRAAAERLATGELQISHRPEHVAHMRVEYGLDHRLFEQDRRLQRLRLGEPPSAEELEPIRVGYADAFGERFSPGELVRGHRMLRRIVHLGAKLSQVQTATWRRHPLSSLLRAGGRSVAPPSRWLPHRANISPILLAILRPCPPPAWLLESVDAFQQEFPDQLVSLLNQDPEQLASATL